MYLFILYYYIISMTISLDIYKNIRNNKELIIKNFYYKREQMLLPKSYRDLTNDDITRINQQSMINIQNDILYKTFVIVFNEFYEFNEFNEFSEVSDDTLICYTNGEKTNFTKYDEIYKKYKDYDNSINKSLREITINQNFIELLRKMAQENDSDCNSDKKVISIPRSDLKAKIESRQMLYGTFKYETINDFNKSGIWFYVIYDDIIFYLEYVKSLGKKNVYLCENSDNTTLENNNFIEFIQNPYSPVRNAMEDPKNNPGPTFSPEKLNKRNSISKISDIYFNKTELNERINESSTKQFGNYKSRSYFKNEHTNPEHLKYLIKETMQCFRNDRDNKGKLLFNSAKSNYRREPFLKQVLNFPTIRKNANTVTGKNKEKIVSCDLDLIKKIKYELNNVLNKIKDKYPPEEGKKFFLMDLEGGAAKHFDYSLYAFTEDELAQPQDTFLTKNNLWKKLEFKSYADKKTIAGLSNYLSKSPIQLFDTVNSTFGKEFVENANAYDETKKWLISINENSDEKTIEDPIQIKWLKKNIDGNEYFAKAIENILQGQKDKIYIIWNVKDKQIYLDEFPPEELAIKRIDDKPVIELDEKSLKKGIIRINAKTINDVFTHEITYSIKINGDKIKQNVEDVEDIQDVQETENKNGSLIFRLKRKEPTSFETDNGNHKKVASLSQSKDDKINKVVFKVKDKVIFTHYKSLYYGTISGIKGIKRKKATISPDNKDKFGKDGKLDKDIEDIEWFYVNDKVRFTFRDEEYDGIITKITEDNIASIKIDLDGSTKEINLLDLEKIIE